jgi:hypothetical protein
MNSPAKRPAMKTVVTLSGSRRDIHMETPATKSRRSEPTHPNERARPSAIRLAVLGIFT